MTNARLDAVNGKLVLILSIVTETHSVFPGVRLPSTAHLRASSAVTGTGTAPSLAAIPPSRTTAKQVDQMAERLRQWFSHSASMN